MATPRQIAKKQPRDGKPAVYGASDIAAMCGLDTFRSKGDVVATAIYDSKWEGSEAASVGQMIEPGLLTWASELLGRIRRNPERRVKGVKAPILVHADAVLVADGTPVEAKTSGIISGRPYEDWGSESTGEVPIRVECQVQIQMRAFAAPRAHVPALLARRGRCMFIVDYDADVADWLLEQVERLHRDYVLTRTMPPDSVPALSVLTGIARTEDEIELPEEAIVLVDEYQAHAKTVGRMEKIKNATKAEVLLMLGDAEAGRMPDGRVVTFRMRHRKATAACNYRAINIGKSQLALPAPEENTDE